MIELGGFLPADVEAIAVDGKRLTFSVVCRDEIDQIDDGQHEGLIVDSATFIARAYPKAKTSPN